MIPLLLAAVLQSAPPKPVLLETPDGARQPQIAVNARDVHVVYGTKDAVHVSTSNDVGATFGPSRKIAEVGALALGLRRGPRIVAKGSSIVVSAVAGKEGHGRDEDLLAWRSLDGGATWTADGRINEVPGAAREGLHAMASGSKAETYCVWIDLAKSEPRICCAVSPGPDDARWSPPSVVFSDASGICPCCAPSVASDNSGVLYVMWRGQEHGSRDMVVACSRNQGKTFEKPVKLGEGTWKLDACPMDGGAIDAGDRTLRSVWRRESEVYCAELGKPERKLGTGMQPVIALGHAGEYIAWIESRSGPLLLLTPGSKDPVRLDERACDPALAYGPTPDFPVLATWESGAEKAPRIAVARLDAK